MRDIKQSISGWMHSFMRRLCGNMHLLVGLMAALLSCQDDRKVMSSRNGRQMSIPCIRHKL